MGTVAPLTGHINTLHWFCLAHMTDLLLTGLNPHLRCVLLLVVSAKSVLFCRLIHISSTFVSHKPTEQNHPETTWGGCDWMTNAVSPDGQTDVVWNASRLKQDGRQKSTHCHVGVKLQRLCVKHQQKQRRPPQRIICAFFHKWSNEAHPCDS